MGYLNLVDSFIYKDPVFRAKLDALTENDAFLKDNGWNNSTKALFYQASAPTGWTKDTSTNDKFLRVVSTIGGGTGGSVAPSAGITLAHSVHSISTSSDHTHNLNSHTHVWARSGSVAGGRSTEILDVGGYLYANRDVGGGSSAPIVSQTSNTTTFATSGSGGAHNHGGATSDSKLSNITLAYCDVIACSKDSGGGTYTDLTSEFHSGDIINFDPFSELAGNDAYLYARIMPASSVMIFGQACAPTGWTKVSTTNDKALRIVSGTGAGTGGSTALSSSVSMSHTHTTPTNAGHTHSTPNHSHTFPSATNRAYSTSFPEAHYVNSDGTYLRTASNNGPSSLGTVYKTNTVSDGSGTTGTSTDDGHTHSLQTPGTSWQLAYLDVIQCSKDASGEPYAYEDVTSGVFGWKKLVSKQKLNKLAKNDEHILFHTPETGMKTLFFMASAPITWTRLTTQDDKALRIVSGGTGGSSGGGSQLLSVALPLAHTHATSSQSHSHPVGSHTHAIDSGSQTVNPYTNGGATGGKRLVFDSTIFPGKLAADNTTGSSSAVIPSTAATSDYSDTVSHDHGTSGSALTDVTLAYADVIYCSKD